MTKSIDQAAEKLAANYLAGVDSKLFTKADLRFAILYAVEAHAKLQDERVRKLVEALEKANNKLDEIAETFDHHNIHISGWHLNGELECAAKFFSENDWYSDGEALEEFRKDEK